jgi:hypothetical protein
MRLLLVCRVWHWFQLKVISYDMNGLTSGCSSAQFKYLFYGLRITLAN